MRRLVLKVGMRMTKVEVRGTKKKNYIIILCVCVIGLRTLLRVFRLVSHNYIICPLLFEFY